MKTANDIYGYAQDLLRLDGATAGIPAMEESRTLQWVNDLVEQYYQEFEDAGVNGPDFLAKETGFVAATETTLDADATAGATTFTVEYSTSFDDEGMGVIYRNGQADLFQYGDCDGETFTSVDGIDFDHDEGEIVGKLYALPATFSRMRKGKGHDGVTVNSTGYFRAAEPGTQTYALVNNTDGDLFLWLPTQLSGDIRVTYDRKPATVTALTGNGSLIEIQGQGFWYVVHGLIALFRQAEDEDYVPQKEMTLMQDIIAKEIKKRSLGRVMSASNAYFRAYGI